MAHSTLVLTRRSALVGAAALLLQGRLAGAAGGLLVTVHKDPNCGCCSGWVKHLQAAGFVTKVADTAEMEAVKSRLGVPDSLAACHTAEVAGYVVEGHVPALAIKRLLADRPTATGLAVAGMPVGSPGMEGGKPERYEVILFGPRERWIFMRFLGEQQI